MSAFMVSIEHIRALVNAGLNLTYGPLSWQRALPTTEQLERSHERGMPWSPDAPEIAREIRTVLTPDTAEAVGVMLMAQNRRSMDFRYDETEIEDLYTHEPSTPRTVVELLKAIDCYEYQACETPDWEVTEAYRFCEALRRELTYHLPGWGQAAWAIDTP